MDYDDDDLDERFSVWAEDLERAPTPREAFEAGWFAALACIEDDDSDAD